MHGRPRGERGSVTAETAVVLPALVLLTVAVFWGIAVCAAQLRCIDAARAGARAAARGEDPAASAAAARAAAPQGATVHMVRNGEQVRVLVAARIDPPGALLSHLPGIPVSGTAVAAAEPGVP